MSRPPEDTSTSGLGERRRRREAERARQRERQRSEPLTRRELRARDEALASGALTYGPDGLVPTAEFDRIAAESLSAASAADPVTAASADEPLPGTRRARRAALRQASGPEESAGRAEALAGSGGSEHSEQPAERAVEAAGSSEQPAERAVEAAEGSDGSAEGSEEPEERAVQSTEGSEEPADRPEEPAEPDSTGPPVRSAPSASSDGGPATALMTPVSRRSVQDRRAAAAPVPSRYQPEHFRTSTGRRPVVRPPATVRATRGVNPSGELTAIQRAVREANTAAEGIPVVEQGEASSPTSWGSAVDIPLMGAEVSQQDLKPATDHRAPSAPSPAVPGTPSPELPAAPSPAPNSAPAPGETGAAAPSATTPATVSTEVSTAQPADPVESVATPSAPADEEVASEEYVVSGEEEEDDGTFDLKPKWEALQGPQTASHPAKPRPGQATEPLRRAATPDLDRDESPAPAPPSPAVDPEAELLEEEARKTPVWLFALQMVVLVLVVAVLGVLVYLFATGDLFGENNGIVAMGLPASWSAPVSALAP